MAPLAEDDGNDDVALTIQYRNGGSLSLKK